MDSEHTQNRLVLTLIVDLHDWLKALTFEQTVIIKKLQHRERQIHHPHRLLSNSKDTGGHSAA